jgi:hypothetical protein
MTGPLTGTNATTVVAKHSRNRSQAIDAECEWADEFARGAVVGPYDWSAG